ncbi:GlxA family transcriptional regulator [Micromonospora yangpuensis]|uniref:Transcriptional regulator GlxA family, contains an amidase domain and an AraC-type DNA-binding HTH domain n=1 Tax=Micromonospora yangpuensis TaxID=683228 RepID=A0A1C6ULT1_9ACTN|nr:helix-turn-helix domain-containing protein [Micromonospora yangpuensis]GGM18002.1 AraC family transcriptional regulator [Micromonospora yangpuensis]SCL54948.1 Transcriptional regulator GlxA family, contains an amidase domain and an AraC-type DNA-binding HTH domain [Micromonospora yangpuensis]
MGGVRVVVVGYPAAELLDIACLTTTFDYANRAGRDPRYTVGVASPGGRPISCQAGLTLAAQTSLERLRGPIDTLIVAGGEGHLAAAGDARLVGHVRRLARETRRVASVCTGASVLAAAGLLDGRRATTHWMFADQLAATYPAVRVDPTPLYVRDGQVSTAAGVTSALDLALAFVAEDHGGEVARRVAQGLVTYLHRPGNQAQMSMFLTAPAPSDALVRRLVAMINDAPAADLSLTALAARAAVSERHLTRLFVAQLGQTPARYVRTVRLEAAAHLLASSRLPLARIADRCGFASAEALRQAFVDRYGVTPSGYRASYRVTVQPSAASTRNPTPSGTSSSMQNSANDRGTTRSRR